MGRRIPRPLGNFAYPRRLPRWSGGERAFPYEDSGGVYGYREMMKILRRPTHPGCAQTREWAGPYYDPEEFDVDFVNRQLRTGRHLVRM
jgi:hypothetical protein